MIVAENFTVKFLTQNCLTTYSEGDMPRFRDSGRSRAHT